MKNVIVLQSGGPTSVINASLVGIIDAFKLKMNENKIYGAINGINGIINDDLIDLTNFLKRDLKIIKTTPSAYLGSARRRLSESIYDDNQIINQDYQNVLTTIDKYNIGYILIIGGNDSMDTVDKLHKLFATLNKEVNVIGVPKTIDNDLIITDHTPGYGSALKYIATVISEIKLDTSVYDYGRVTIVEIMGRDSGWLTCGASLPSINGLGADLIYLPEVCFDVETFLKDVLKIYEKERKVLVCISEGIKDAYGNYILSHYSYNEINDVFGHMQLGGTSTVLAQLVKSKLNIPVRSMELNLAQRCAGHILSKTDVCEAYSCGSYALENVLTTSGKFVIMKRLNQQKYEITYELIDVCEVANKVKHVPREYIVNNNQISPLFLDYALPLISGEVSNPYHLGMPKYIHRKK